jgi:hypothetical protein
MGAVLYLFKEGSVTVLAAAMLTSCIVYLGIIFKLRAFSETDLELAREGMRFWKPFLGKWPS